MRYSNALHYLSSFINFERIPFEYRRELNLKRMEKLLSWFGHPQTLFPSVLVAGTKGKGSTAHFLSSILSANGYKTGLYTSPHLIDPRERIRVGRKAISKTDFALIVRNIRSVLEKKQKEISKIGPVTFFEIFTLAAILYFAYAKVEIAVFEVGMGGRLDATNVLHPLVSVITSISYDHEEHLGHTLTSIASEKAAIIKPKSLVVCARQEKEAAAVLQKKVIQSKAKAYWYGRDFFSVREKISPLGNRFDFKIDHQRWQNFQTQMAGTYQIQNASVALQTAGILENHFVFPLTKNRIREGLKNAFWPGRFERVKRFGRTWIVDGAHNGASMAETVKTLNRIYGKHPFTVILGTSREKKIKDLLIPLAALNPLLILTKSTNPRAMEPKLMLEAASSLGFKRPTMIYPDLDDAIKIASQITDKNDILLVTGSLFLVGEAREKLKCPKFV